MTKKQKLKRILGGSFNFEITRANRLELTSRSTGERITIDLNYLQELDEDDLDELIDDEDEEEDEA